MQHSLTHTQHSLIHTPHNTLTCNSHSLTHHISHTTLTPTTHADRLQIHLSALNTDADGSLSFDVLFLLLEVANVLLVATDFLLAV